MGEGERLTAVKMRDVQAGRDIHVVIGISEKQLVEELGVTRVALKKFFEILEQKQVPPEDLDHTFREIAKRYNDLRQQLQSFSSDDPAVNELRQQAAAALEAGEFGRAEELLNQARDRDLEAAKQLQEVAHKRLLSAAASAAATGNLKYTQLAYVEAAKYYRQAADILPSDAGEILAGYLNLLGLALNQAGDYAGAEAPWIRALAIREQVLGPHHPDVATSLNNLALLYRAQGKYAEAEPLFQRALAVWEKTLGPHHPHVAQSLNNLALLYHAQGKYAEAEPLFQRALAVWEKTLGPHHPDVAQSLNNLAELYRAQGKYAEAEPLYQRAVAIFGKTFGAHHPNTITALENYALLLRQMGREDEAPMLKARA